MQEVKVASSVEFVNQLFASGTQLDDVVSESRYWSTREGEIRRKIYKMTQTESNISSIYRDLLRAMISSFNDVAYINSEEKLIDIKCIHANAERAVAKLTQENNIILPILSVAQTISDNDATRNRYESLLVHEKVWDSEKNRAFRVLSLSPRAVNYMANMDQILEQVRLKFNPEMEVPTKHGTLTKALLESEEAAGSITAGDKEDRVLKKTLNIVVRTYIPNPKFLVTATGKIEKFYQDMEVPT